MKKILKSSVIAAAILGCGATGALATPAVDLDDWIFNIDGTVFAAPADITDMTAVPVTGTLNGSGLGMLNWSTSTAGAHSFLAFFDHEIDQATNTFFNESGNTTGSAATGQSWEIDEPGYDFGDLIDNVVNDGALDNTNGVPIGLEDDVSMALGWDFVLGDNKMAIITLTLSATAPLEGFYLTQYDPDSDVSIFYSSNLVIKDTTIPEPTTILLMGAGLAGLAGVRRRTRKA